jgi:succinate-semialdehyde dehydrogenase/glutarate-semialdehyde dehydrogenase
MGAVAGIQIKTTTNGKLGIAPRSVLKSRAPATGQLLGEVEVTSPELVVQAVRRAQTAQLAWRELPLEERCDRLLRFRDALVAQAEDVVELLVRETGKPRNEALGHELFVLADLISWYAKHAPRILARRELGLHLLKHRRSFVEYAPRGVVGILSPWNFPLLIPFGDAAAALVTGSAAVIKPSEVTPLIAELVKQIWDATGLPEDLLQIVYGDAETGAALIAARVDKVVFTGGVAAGSKVAAACGERLIECVLELGGKAPLLVTDDADIERAAQAITFGGFANAGQVCVGVERVYAHRDVYDELVERVTDLTRQLRVGDPTKQVVDVGAIIHPRQIEIAERHVTDAVKKGATLRAGGRRRAGPGQFFEPTVLSDCNHEMSVMREEIFGPIVPFMVVTSDEQAIELCNESQLGLNAYVFAGDRERALAICERIEAGSVAVNDVMSNYATSEAPFGGLKQSGFGRIHGEEGLRAMAVVRHVSFDRIRPPKRDPLWFPYSDLGYEWGMKGLRMLFSGQGLLRRVRELL